MKLFGLDLKRVRLIGMYLLIIGYFVLGWYWFNVPAYKSAIISYGVFGIGLFIFLYFLDKIA